MAYLRDWDEQSNGWEDWEQVSPYESPRSDSDRPSANQRVVWPHIVDPLPGHVMRRAQAVFYTRPIHDWLFENLRPFFFASLWNRWRVVAQFDGLLVLDAVYAVSVWQDSLWLSLS